MGLFGTTSPFDADVEKVTDEKNTNENWSAIMDICDRVTSSSNGPKDVVRSICKRMNSAIPNVAMQALVLLDACVKNCGKNFHLEVASRDMEAEIRKLIGKGHPKVSEKLKSLLKKWAEGEFKSDPQLSLIPSLYSKLRQDGTSFNSDPSVSEKKVSFHPDAVSSKQEEDDIAKAIELSLKETSGSSPNKQASGSSVSSTTTTSSLYPSAYDSAAFTSTGAAAAPATLRTVRALYDFEAAEDNELTFFAGEIVNVIDDSDSNWWKGSNQRGEGLFPANFVTADLSAEPDQFKIENKKTVQFSESVEVKTVEREPEVVEIDENKITQTLHLLHEADPTGEREDIPDMLHLEEQVSMMSPLIEAQIDRIDRRHAQLTSLNSQLADALNLYHNLMREGSKLPYTGYPPAPIHPPPSGYAPPPMPQGYAGAMPPPPASFMPPAVHGNYVAAVPIPQVPDAPPPHIAPQPPHETSHMPPPLPHPSSQQIMYSGGEPASYGHIPPPPQGSFPPQSQPLL